MRTKGETKGRGDESRKTKATRHSTPSVSAVTRECSGEANVRYAGDAVPNEVACGVELAIGVAMGGILCQYCR